VSYQIPKYVEILFLKGDTAVPLQLFTPEEIVKLKHTIVTMFISKLTGADFKMKINVYFDSQGRRLAFSSSEVSGLDIERGLYRYCEIRFDFPALGNLLNVGHQYFLEFEISDYSASHDEENYIGLIKDHDSPLAIMAQGSHKFIVRHSNFMETA
jgi:hypothetical protein